jgi:hypothetical protein
LTESTRRKYSGRRLQIAAASEQSKKPSPNVLACCMLRRELACARACGCLAHRLSRGVPAKPCFWTLQAAGNSLPSVVSCLLELIGIHGAFFSASKPPPRCILRSQSAHPCPVTCSHYHEQRLCGCALCSAVDANRGPMQRVYKAERLLVRPLSVSVCPACHAVRPGQALR